MSIIKRGYGFSRALGKSIITFMMCVMISIAFLGCEYLCNPNFDIQEDALYFQNVNENIQAADFSFYFIPNTCTHEEVPQASASYRFIIGRPNPGIDDSYSEWEAESMEWLVITPPNGSISPGTKVTVRVEIPTHLDLISEQYYIYITGECAFNDEHWFVDSTKRLPMINTE